MAAKLILCPGQGAQFAGMGRAWFERSAEARAIFERADTLMGNRLGLRLSDACFSGAGDRLNRTDVAQPAIFVTSVACWHALLASWSAGGGAGVNGVSGGGALESQVLATAGLSLGEYTALYIAGAMHFDDALELVALRGRAMQDAADHIRLPDGTPGSGMVALIGADEAQANVLCEQARAGEVLTPANFNAPGQIVISGSMGACARAVELAGTMGLRATMLQVAGAFHSELMRPAADRLEAALRSTTIRAPRCAVASNVSGRTYETSPGVGGGESGGVHEDTIRRSLVAQLTSPVRWAENCQNLVGLAQRTGDGGSGAWHELAPGKTLSGLMRRIDKSAKVETHDEP